MERVTRAACLRPASVLCVLACVLAGPACSSSSAAGCGVGKGGRVVRVALPILGHLQASNDPRYPFSVKSVHVGDVIVVSPYADWSQRAMKVDKKGLRIKSPSATTPLAACSGFRFQAASKGSAKITSTFAITHFGLDEVGIEVHVLGR